MPPDKVSPSSSRPGGEQQAERDWTAMMLSRWAGGLGGGGKGLGGKAQLLLRCFLCPEAPDLCPGLCSMPAPSPRPHLSSNNCLLASGAAGLSGWQDRAHPDGYQEPQPHWEGRDQMLRKRQRVGDACVIGTLPSSWSGALPMLWGSCPPGHSQIPPPQDPFLISQPQLEQSTHIPTCESST